MADRSDELTRLVSLVDAFASRRVLVVGINDDEPVKAPGDRRRPVTPGLDRAEIVRACSGRIAIVRDPKDHSTRDLLQRLGAPPAPLSRE